MRLGTPRPTTCLNPRELRPRPRRVQDKEVKAREGFSLENILHPFLRGTGSCACR